MDYDLAMTCLSDAIKEAFHGAVTMPNITALNTLELALEDLGLGGIVRAHLSATYDVEHFADLKTCDMSRALNFVLKLRDEIADRPPAQVACPIPRGMTTGSDFLLIRGQVSWADNVR